MLDDNKIDYVYEYKYLGQIIALDNRMNKELRAETASSWRNFLSLKFLLKSSKRLDKNASNKKEQKQRI